MKRTVGGKLHYVYNAVTPYVKPVIEQPDENAIGEEAAAHSRVVRLIDRPYVNPDPNKKISRREGVAIGSSMTMFGGW